MQSWEWRRGMRTASACDNGTARCETVCSPSSNIPMRRRTTTAVSGNCGRQPPIARSRAGSAQAGAPICSLPFDQLSVPQHDVDLMRIRQFVLSWTANLSFYRVEQLPDSGDLQSRWLCIDSQTLFIKVRTSKLLLYDSKKYVAISDRHASSPVSQVPALPMPPMTSDFMAIRACRIINRSPPGAGASRQSPRRQDRQPAGFRTGGRSSAGLAGRE